MSETISVFAYGSLMVPRVMEMVTGRSFTQRPGVLEGYARYALRGETYPGLVEEAHSAVEGVLWGGVDADSLARLDAFEDEWFARRTVDVRCDDEHQPAEAYVLVESQRHRVSHRRWILSRFEQRHLQRFLLDYSRHAAPKTE